MSDNKRGIKKTTKDCLVLISITLSTKAQFVVDVSQGIKSEFLPYEHQLGYKNPIDRRWTAKDSTQL
jgi:hypothetical protein